MHLLPDIGADIGTYRYADGCVVLLGADAVHEFIPYPDARGKPDAVHSHDAPEPVSYPDDDMA